MPDRLRHRLNAKKKSMISLF